MLEPAQAGAALLLGLSGAGHCLGMCGGIAGALNLGGAQGHGITLAYHAGRIASYTLLGAMLGFAAGSIDISAWTIAMRYIAGFLLNGMGLYIADWWRGMQVLERAGARLWAPIQRFASAWLPARHWYQGLALGLCWGMMPCGLIYSSLALAATAQDAPTSAAMMFIFGVGTLPAMLSVSLGAARLQAVLRRRGLKLLIASLLIVSGLWTLYVVASHGGHHQHAGEHVMEPSGQDMIDHSGHEMPPGEHSGH
ncbi:MAG: sulfite exporter TauE/SafE family protein [Halioglobus sp.]|nr:sulfite exporter TauE/SafE family protein [Halioglobus sp.]